MVTRTQHVARALTWLYLLVAAGGVIAPMGARIGTLKWRSGYRLTGGVTPS